VSDHLAARRHCRRMERLAMAPKIGSDRLIETYRSYSHAISAEVLRKYPSVDRDDIIGAAELGLVEAANNFDPSRGVLFKTFAYYRIRGAIYDSLRKMGWFAKDPARMRFESGANEYLKNYADGRPPADTDTRRAPRIAVVNRAFLRSLPIEGSGLGARITASFAKLQAAMKAGAGKPPGKPPK